MVLFANLFASYILGNRVWALASMRLILLLLIQTLKARCSGSLFAAILLWWRTRWRILFDVTQTRQLRELSRFVVWTCRNSWWILPNNEIIDVIVVDLRAIVYCGVWYVAPHIVNNVGNYLGILLTSRCSRCLIVRSSCCFLLFINNFTLWLSLWNCTWLLLLNVRLSIITSILSTLSVISPISCCAVSFFIVIEIQCTARRIGSFFRLLRLIRVLLLLLLLLFFIFTNLRRRTHEKNNCLPWSCSWADWTLLSCARS